MYNINIIWKYVSLKKFILIKFDQYFCFQYLNTIWFSRKLWQKLSKIRVMEVIQCNKLVLTIEVNVHKHIFQTSILRVQLFFKIL